MGRKVCCNCGKDLGPAPLVNGITHGYCDDCAKEARREVDEFLRKLKEEKKGGAR